ncbi:MAG: sulfotransferase [Hyphomonas sp.]
MSSDTPTDKSAPDAIVIGAMRAGTTTLYRAFKDLGIVAVPEAKETDYYLAQPNFALGDKWYRNQFRNSPLPWVDFCPNYTKRDIFPETVGLIHANAPNAKLIFIARDPVDRAISQYNHTFMHSGSMPDPAALLDTDEGVHILKASEYAYQLEPYYKRWRKEDILIVDFDELVEDMPAVIDRIARHIGLDMQALQEKADAALELATANSSDELRKMPRWWGQLRDTSAGRFVRTRVPRNVIDSVRTIVRGNKKADIPKFSPSVRKRIAKRLKADAERFRQVTGLPFDNWSI